MTEILIALLLLSGLQYMVAALLSTGLDSAQPKPHDWLLFTVQ
jgi:hypothetical protein